MINSHYDTIVAVATPIGKGGVSIIKISGNMVLEISNLILKKIPCPRKAEYLSFFDKYGETIDTGIVIFFPSPYSYTGEDILELHIHGSPIIVDLLICRILSISDNNIRIASPGEFSKRAFLNGKLDLIQAEAICDLINSNSPQAARLAIDSIKGKFSSFILDFKKKISDICVYIEAKINFPDEEISDVLEQNMKVDIENIILKLKDILLSCKKGKMLYSGIKVVITGEPNVGKSTLFNMLTNSDDSIVTSLPGTTRNILRSSVYSNGVLVTFVDTAGIHNTTDEVEIIGIEKALLEIKDANYILYVVDSRFYNNNVNFNVLFKNLILNNFKEKNQTIIVVRNKIDLIDKEKYVNFIKNKYNISVVTLSTKYKLSINILQKKLYKCIDDDFNAEELMLSRFRHIKYIEQSLCYLYDARDKLDKKYIVWELLSEDLRLSINKLNNILGIHVTPDLLKKIFSKFCVGK